MLSTQNVPTMGGAYEITVGPRCTEFTHKGDGKLYYISGPEPAFSSWGGKQTYRVAVTKGMVQDCFTFVEALSTEEARALVEKRPEEAFEWTTEPRSHSEYKVVGSGTPEVERFLHRDGRPV